MYAKPTKQQVFNPLVQQNSSLNKRILRVVIATVFVLLTLFLISDYYTTINHIEQLTLKRLQGIANCLSSRIDGDQHQKLSQDFLQMGDIAHNGQDKNYKKIHATLAQAYITHDLSSPLYTFVKTGAESKKLEFIATSSEEPYYRHSYTSFPENIFPNLEKGGTIGLYKDEFGHWLSAFAPIRNRKGEIVAFIQTDEKFDDFIYKVRAKTMRNAFLCIIGFVIVILILLPYLKQLLKEEEKQKEMLKKALNKTQRLSKKLEKNELALMENAKKLKQSNKDLTDFAHIASHDLKAPIRNIASFAQLLKKQKASQLDDTAIDYLNFIITSSDQAQKLICGLLSYSTADKDLGEQTKFQISEAVNIAKSNLTSVIEEKRAILNFEEMTDVKANPTLIAQVFQNLINNGVKYNQATRPVIEVGEGIDEENGRYFYVKDNGIGIPEKYQKNIFKMFTRLHSAKEYEGSGIGLAFCNRVVDAYGGKMWLESNTENGSTFYFTLPNAVLEVESVLG